MNNYKKKHDSIVCCLIVLTHKFVAYVEYNWATCTVVSVGFSCATSIVDVYVEVADGSFRIDELGLLDFILSIFRHCAGNQVPVFLFLLGEDRCPSNSGFWDEIRVQSLVCVILIMFWLMYCFLTYGRS
jgi:hypothetical protein